MNSGAGTEYIPESFFERTAAAAAAAVAAAAAAAASVGEVGAVAVAANIAVRGAGCAW